MAHPYDGTDRPLSYSQMNTYGSCSRKWFFRYIQKAKPTKVAGALVLGTAMHSLIQEAVVNNYRTDVLPDLFPGHWNKAKERNGDLPFPQDDAQKNYDIGQRMLASPEMPAAIWELQDAGVMKVEHFFKFQIPGHTKPIIGYIDMIDRQGMAYDIKTAGRMWSDADFAEDRQSTLYLLGLIQDGIIQPEYPLEFTFLIITKAKKPRWVLRKIERTKDDMTRLQNWLKEMDDHIASGVHKADPRPNWVCSYCDFEPICKKGLIFPKL